MGRSLVRGILNSSRGISDKDNSPEAQARRRINGFAELDGLEFVARVDIGQDTNGEDKNEIKSAVMPDHRDYAQVMGLGAPGMPGGSPAPDYAAHGNSPQVAPVGQGQGAAVPQAPQQPDHPLAAPGSGFAGRPSWAE